MFYHSDFFFYYFIKKVSSIKKAYLKNILERPSPLSIGQIHHELQDKLSYASTVNNSNNNNSMQTLNNNTNNNTSKSTPEHHQDGSVSDDDDDANKRRGPRTTIKAKQLELLKAAFIATPKPSRHIREKLAADTGKEIIQKIIFGILKNYLLITEIFCIYRCNINKMR